MGRKISDKLPLTSKNLEILTKLSAKEKERLTTEDKEEKVSARSKSGVRLCGELPLEMLIAARIAEDKTGTEFFVDAEPVKNGSTTLTSTPFTEALFADRVVKGQEDKEYAHISCNDINQGLNGNCWMVAAMGAVLALPNGHLAIAVKMRDLSEEFEGQTLGELLELPELLRDSIVVLWFKDKLPFFAVVKKSTIDGDFRVQSPFYVQMLEKSYIGLFLEGDYQKARGGLADFMFNAFTTGATQSKSIEAVNLDVSANRKQRVEEFKAIFQSENAPEGSEVVNEIFGHYDAMVQKFIDLWLVLKNHPNFEKGFSSPQKLITKLDEIFPPAIFSTSTNDEKSVSKKSVQTDVLSSVLQKMPREALRAIIECLKNYASALTNDHSYYPFFKTRIEYFLFEISASHRGSPTSSQEVPFDAKKARPAIISFDPAKVKTKQRAFTGEPISAQGLIAKHGFILSHVGRQYTQIPGKKPKIDHVVYLINPWGKRGTQIVYDQKENLKLIPTENNTSTVTIDHLICYGKEIAYDRSMELTPEIIQYELQVIIDEINNEAKPEEQDEEAEDLSSASTSTSSSSSTEISIEGSPSRGGIFSSPKRSTSTAEIASQTAQPTS